MVKHWVKHWRRTETTYRRIAGDDHPRGNLRTFADLSNRLEKVEKAVELVERIDTFPMEVLFLLLANVRKNQFMVFLTHSTKSKKPPSQDLQLEKQQRICQTGERSLLCGWQQLK